MMNKYQKTTIYGAYAHVTWLHYRLFIMHTRAV